LGNAGTGDEENFAARMRKKEALGNSRQARPQENYSIVSSYRNLGFFLS